jgi:hypothetical protein
MFLPLDGQQITKKETNFRHSVLLQERLAKRASTSTNYAESESLCSAESVLEIFVHALRGLLERIYVSPQLVLLSQAFANFWQHFVGSVDTQL